MIVVGVLLWLGSGPPLFAAEMVEVPAGPVGLGPPAETGLPPRTRDLDAFFIDRTEVTNRAFAQHVPDHEYRPGAAEHPVTQVSWRQARDYCALAGKRLPSEAEWEKAARGTDGRLYPWGDRPLRRKPHPFYSGVVKRTAGLDFRDVSPYRAFDMAGSVWEWTADADGDQKVARGGLWNLHLDFEYSKTFDRILVDPEQRFIFLGFRCARSND